MFTIKFRELIGKKIIYLDGGMGSVLQQKGLQAGELPEILNITNPKLIQEIHYEYYLSGSNVTYSNTFGANKLKYEDTEHDYKELIVAAIDNVRAARERLEDRDEKFIALDVGPIGKLLKPVGDLDFEEAVEIFKEVIKTGADAGADLIAIETMSDTYELKAAVLAAKEVCDLPIIATVAFSDDKRLLNGADVKTVISLLEGLRVDALGMNCGLDPRNIKDIVEEFLQYSSLPLVLKPNAGIPENINGEIKFNMEPDDFGKIMREFVEMGANIVGGCCGTTHDHIRRLYEETCSLPLITPSFKNHTFVSSYTKTVICNEPKIIGERINPTGKKLLKQALINKDMSYILKEAIAQEEKGAHILDVNTGLNEIDEQEMSLAVMRAIQEISTLPLQIDSAKTNVLETSLRYYNGKAMLNSVNGKKKVMEEIFPIVKKYGAVVVALTIDDDGIPNDAIGRYNIAKNIVETAKEYGIDKKDIVVDPLCMTISSDKNAANQTLKALSMIKENLGVKTILGVSNISFGLPKRELINHTFFTSALRCGLDFGIINPGSDTMMMAYDAHMVLAGFDENSSNYIAKYSNDTTVAAPVAKASEMSLKEAIKKGLKEDSFNIAKAMLNEHQPLDIINSELIPALDEVGAGFEKGVIFLPQLMMSADSASRAFDALKEKMTAMEDGSKEKQKIILATVKGDVHDIGKNIVKVLLENYGYDVYDLGKDVDYDLILDTIKKEKVYLVGLSALMTTTVDNMQETIRLIREKIEAEVKIMVGGAVLTKAYAEKIGADRYCKDAMESVRYAKEVFGE
ncbi:homocysteine S-methyltransferase [Peptostreptococcaceae bacterium AS15]|nr:homocysteine S-methyltransferase [Peptostreptococcaceae bacterium AS15]